MKKPNYVRFFIVVAAFIVCYVALLAMLIKIEAHNPEANIKNFGDALWFSIVTLTTVGYGDLHPVTHEGKMFASILL
ncbi:ion channel [Fulvivirga sp.]|uniref:potassium channel family protein n=1 Tax=Fulvivirga sp. TaxID=1931237 RepID=UPI0032EDD4E7